MARGHYDFKITGSLDSETQIDSLRNSGKKLCYFLVSKNEVSVTFIVCFRHHL